MSFSCILYPAVGSSYTQLLGSIVPYPFAGYDRTSSLGTTLPIRWVQNRPRTSARTTEVPPPCTRRCGSCGSR